MKTKLFRSLKDGGMWMNLPTGEKEPDSKFMKKERVDIESITPVIPSHLWGKTISGKTVQVEVHLDQFDVVEETRVWNVPAITTDKGTVLSPARSGSKAVYRLVAKVPEETEDDNPPGGDPGHDEQ